MPKRLSVRGGSAIRLLIPAMAAGLIGCSDDAGPTQPPATITVPGLVREADTEALISGALVRLGDAAATTGEDGRFAIPAVPVGASLSMTVSRSGFETHTRTITVQAGSNDQVVVLVRNHIYVADRTAAYVPPDPARIEGALFLLPGANDDTRPFIAADRGAAFGRLAEKHGLALVGAAARTGVQLSALEVIAVESGRPELATAPLLLAGYSEGACFAVTSSNENPDRIIGALVMKAVWLDCGHAVGGWDAAPLRGAPVYILVGEFENPALATALFEERRAGGAMWAIAIQKGKGHEAPGPDDDPWILEWFDAVLTYRLPDGAAPGTSAGLRPIPAASGWLGDRSSLAIARYDCYAGDALAASWLPSERSAQQWQSIVSAGDVTTVTDC